MSNQFTTIEENTTRVLNRYSVLDLRELSPEQFEKSEELFSNSSEMKLIDSGEMALIQWWEISSNGHLYEVRRFEHFSYCSCNFYYFNKVCKHIAFTFPAICPKCQKPSETKGEKCGRCEMDTSMKFSSLKQSERIGGFRI